MYTGYLYPYYRSFPYPYPAYGYPAWGYGGVWGGYGNYSANNIIGSAVANQSLINTGTAAGINQIATPTVIGW
jgi:hypothetical protein